MEAVRRRALSCILIAPRLSALRDCDRILVLERGILVETGDHRSLIASGGVYASLVEA